MMRMRQAILFFAFSLSALTVFSQCAPLGQTTPTAFPVCGTLIFQQSSVPLCSGQDLLVPGCNGDGALYSNKNPYWYKFTCYQSGTLVFTITPNAIDEDYDWQLYDVTGHDPNEVYTNAALIVTGNWSGTFGPTGASATGVNYIQCASVPSDNKPTFALGPMLIQGHNYLLLISHFTDTQSGYSLAFGGGTSSITDPLDPHLASATAPCDGTEIRIVTNKKMKCSTLAADGSDFTVSNIAGNYMTISASSIQCGSSFDMDTLSLFLSAPLVPGSYTLTIKNGTDGNTLQDNCDKLIPVGEQQIFTVYPLFPTPLDSVTVPKCAPQTLELVFKKKIMCNSIAPGGGDFSITGPYPVTITAAGGNCVNGLTDRILFTLSAPMTVDGNFTVHLQQGPDGNTIIDECGMETPLPAQRDFHVSDTVNANFTYSVNYSCTRDVVSYAHDGANHVNMWHWSFGTAPDAFIQTPVVTYTDFHDKTTMLIVSNGVCMDTASVKLSFANYLDANFEVTPLVCPNNPVSFINHSVGDLTGYQWIFGNGFISNVKDPAPQVFLPLEAADYTALPKLIVTNSFNCKDTFSAPVKIVYSCFIAVPSAFTPNGDGLNDYLYPLKAYKSSNLNFSIYNRFGQRVFYSNDWQKKWDGTFKGLRQEPGTYVWMLEYDNTQSGKHVFQKGTSILIR